MKYIKTYKITAIGVAMMAFGFVSDTIFEGVYYLISTDKVTRMVLWCSFWIFVMFEYELFPRFHPLFHKAARFYLPVGKSWQFRRIEGYGDKVFIYIDNVYYSCDETTSKLLALDLIPIKSLPIDTYDRGTNLKEKTAIVTIDNCNLFRVDLTTPRYFIEFGVEWVEITDVYSFNVILNSKKKSNSRIFTLVSKVEFEKWPGSQEYSESLLKWWGGPKNFLSISQIRSDIQNRSEELSIIKLKENFQENAVDYWLKDRYFPDLHFILDEEKRLAAQFNLDLLRSELIKRAYNTMREVDQLKSEWLIINDANQATFSISRVNEIVLKKITNCSNSTITELNNLRLEPDIDKYVLYKNEFVFTISELKKILQNTLKPPNDLNYSTKRDLELFISNLNRILTIQQYPISGSDVNTVILDGEAYTGKTHLLASITGKRLDTDHTSIIYPCGFNNNHIQWLHVIGSVIPVGFKDPDDLWRTLTIATYVIDSKKILWNREEDRVNSPIQFLIAIDGIDESFNIGQWNNLIKKGVKNAASYPKLSYLYSVRKNQKGFEYPATYSHHFLHRSSLPIPQIFEHYSDKYNVHNIEDFKWVGNCLTTPLEVRLFFELFNNSSIEDVSQATVIVGLFNIYFKKISDEIQEKLSVNKPNLISNLFEAIVEYMLNDRKYGISLELLVDKLISKDNDLTKDFVSKLFVALEPYSLIKKITFDSEILYAPNENSILEFYISDLVLNQPDLAGAPDILLEREGALIMYAVQRYIQRNEIIAIDYWKDQFDFEAGKDISIKVASQLPPDKIDEQIVNWIYSYFNE